MTMGKAGGIEIRERSIRFTFIEGRPTLMVNGKPAAPTPANVKWAKRLAAEMRARIEHGTFSMAEYFPAHGAPGAATTVAVQLDNWLGGQRIEHSTRAGYESAARFWKTVLGERALRSVKTGDVLTALASRPELSGKTVNNYVSVLREAFSLAVLDGLTIVNPVEHVPRAKWQKPPADPFTKDEADRIIDAMPEGAVRNMVEWWFYTGVRTSEMAGLRWAQVDLASGYVQISEALVRGVEKASTKTDTVRQVRLNSRAAAALQRQRAITQMAGDRVWVDPRYGTDWTEERAFRRSFWAPALKRLGIRYRRPYNMRHTYATMMLMAGLAPAFCAGQMGHSVEVFLRTYAKWIRGSADDAEMAKLEGSIKGTGT